MKLEDVSHTKSMSHTGTGPTGQTESKYPNSAASPRPVTVRLAHSLPLPNIEMLSSQAHRQRHVTPDNIEDSGDLHPITSHSLTEASGQTWSKDDRRCQLLKNIVHTDTNMKLVHSDTLLCCARGTAGGNSVLPASLGKTLLSALPRSRPLHHLTADQLPVPHCNHASQDPFFPSDSVHLLLGQGLHLVNVILPVCTPMDFVERVPTSPMSLQAPSLSTPTDLVEHVFTSTMPLQPSPGHCFQLRRTSSSAYPRPLCLSKSHCFQLLLGQVPHLVHIRLRTDVCFPEGSGNVL